MTTLDDAMDDPLSRLFVTGASEIGEQILRRGDPGTNTFNWRTISQIQDGRATWGSSASLYSGASGISLFLTELWKVTGEERFIRSARAAMERVATRPPDLQESGYGLYTGRMGAAYALLALWNATREDRFAEMALRMGQSCVPLIRAELKMSDLLGGLAGAILGLLCLHRVTQEEWVLDVIEESVGRLVGAAHHGPSGIYWDPSPRIIRGLCGLAHGASGIGYTFLELGRYFEDPTYYSIAAQSFLYESAYYDRSTGNWPDFRKGIGNREDYLDHRLAFLSGDRAFFTTPSDMNAWCHGAAGIGLARLRSVELTGEPIHEREARKAIARTTQDLRRDGIGGKPSFTLCHGDTGRAELLIEAARVLADEEALANARDVADRVLQWQAAAQPFVSGYPSSEGEEDPSLFMGSSGIGHFLLRLARPALVHSILAPQVASFAINQQVTPARTPACSVDSASVETLLRDSCFRRTCALLRHLVRRQESTAAVRHHVFPRHGAWVEACGEDMKAAISSLPAEHGQRVSDVLELELTIAHMDQEIESRSLLHIAEVVRLENAPAIAADLMSARLTLEESIRIIVTRWDWSSPREEDWLANTLCPTRPTPMLLKATASRVAEIKLSPLSHMVLTAFAQPRTLGDVMRELTTGDTLSGTKLDEECLQAVFSQVSHAVELGLLVPPPGQARTVVRA